MEQRIIEANGQYDALDSWFLENHIKNAMLVCGKSILYPTAENMPKTQYFHDISPEIRSYYEKLWEEILLADE